jgi:3-oxoacyl-[acyl-carrier-protein] synthase-3
VWHLDFASAFPSREVSAAEIAEWTDGDESFIRDKVGIEFRRYLAKDETPLDLAKAAAEKGLAKAGLEVKDLDWLVYVTQNPDFRLPQNSALLADALGADCRIAAFDIALGCSGWVYAITLADAFALREGFRAGLVVTCDPYSRAILRSDKSTTTVFGDAAAATVFGVGGPITIGRGDYGTDGAGGMGLAARSGGARDPVVSIDIEEEVRTVSPADHSIKMDGRAILDFMQTRVPSSVDACLSRNQLERDDISMFVFHQASKYMLTLLARRMQLSPEKVPIELHDTGNTVSSTIPIVLERLSDRGALQGNIIVSGFGVGLSWSTNVLRFPANGQPNGGPLSAQNNGRSA